MSSLKLNQKSLAMLVLISATAIAALVLIAPKSTNGAIGWVRYQRGDAPETPETHIVYLNNRCALLPVNPEDVMAIADKCRDGNGTDALFEYLDTPGCNVIPTVKTYFCEAYCQGKGNLSGYCQNVNVSGMPSARCRCSN